MWVSLFILFYITQQQYQSYQQVNSKHCHMTTQSTRNYRSTHQYFQTPQKQQQNLTFITKLISNEFTQEQDLQYAESQLQNIYSQQLSKIFHEKKYYLKNLQNQERILNKFEIYNKNKLEKLQKMRDRSIEKRQKFIKERLKVYQNNDRKWFHKKQEIKKRFKSQDKQFLQKSKVEQRKSQSFWKIRQNQKIKNMKQFSQKYHCLYNSNYTNKSHQSKSEIPTLNPRQSQQHKNMYQNPSYNQLDLKLTKNKYSVYKSQNRTLSSFNHHRQKQRQLAKSLQRQKLNKIIVKMNKIQKSSQKRQQIKKHDFLQKSKLKNPLKIYKNNKPQIGQQCTKYATRHEKYNNKTQNSRLIPRQQNEINLLESRHNRYNVSQRDYYYEMPKVSKQSKLKKYHQQIKRFKMVKMLKNNVRNMINTQFKRFQTQYN